MVFGRDEVLRIVAGSDPPVKMVLFGSTRRQAPGPVSTSSAPNAVKSASRDPPPTASTLLLEGTLRSRLELSIGDTSSASSSQSGDTSSSSGSQSGDTISPTGSQSSDLDPKKTDSGVLDRKRCHKTPWARWWHLRPPHSRGLRFIVKRNRRPPRQKGWLRSQLLRDSASKFLEWRWKGKFSGRTHSSGGAPRWQQLLPHPKAGKDQLVFRQRLPDAIAWLPQQILLDG